MADQRLRELERRFGSSGSVEDEAAWLRARVHAGELSEDRARLAAWLGSEAACVALEAGSFDARLSVVVRLDRLKDWGLEPPVRAALALAQAAFRTWVGASGEGYVAETRRRCGWAALAATETWIADPSKERALAARRAGGDLRQGHRAHPTSRDDGMRWCAPALATDAVVAPSAGAAAAIAGRLLAVTETGMDRAAAWAAVVAELLPWALGYSDPVRERVEARDREAARE